MIPYRALTAAELSQLKEGQWGMVCDIDLSHRPILRTDDASIYFKGQQNKYVRTIFKLKTNTT